MLHSLKAKFILAFGTLVVVLFASLGLFLVDAKTRELMDDISTSSQAVATFTVGRLMTAYHDFLEPGNFVEFTKQINYTLRRADQISSIALATYSGAVLYDYEDEKLERFSGTLRTLDRAALDRVQSNKTSLLLENGRVIYLLVEESKEVSYVDFNEDGVLAPEPYDRIVNIVVPVNYSYALIYDVNYATMDGRLLNAKIQIASIAGVGFLLTLMISFMLSVSITRPLKALKEGALKIATGDFATRVLVSTKDEIGVLAQTFNQMAADLAASIEAKLYKERVVRELELAADIQANLIPRDRLSLPTLDVIGGLDPATEVGGDAYDFIDMEGGKHLIYIGDGTGHGVPAGIMASISNALLYALRREEDLKVVAKLMNEVIQKKSSNTMFITMALTIWDEKNSTLKYVNAGHLPLLYFDYEAKKLTEVKLPGIAFGMVDDITPLLKEQDIVLKPSDVVVLYSDGIPDAQNERQEVYGVQRLKMNLQNLCNDGHTVDEIRDGLLADVMKFIGKREHLDDITVVVMKRKA